MKAYPQTVPMPVMSKMRFIAAIALFLLSGTFSSAIANSVFVPLSQESIPAQRPEIAPQRENWVTRHQPCGVDFAVLKKACDAEISSLRFNLFDGISLEGEIEQTIFRSDRSYTLVGSLKGAISGDFILSIHEGILAGNFRTLDGSSYQVRYRPGGFHETRIIDESEFPECGVGPEQHVAESGGGIDTLQNDSIATSFEEPPVAADDGSVFDVLVVYTPAARTAAGGTTAMEALTNLAIAETNVAYANSSITSIVKLGHQQEIAYTDSGSMGTDLGRLQNKTDGYMDSVHTLRDTYGADLVSLFNVNLSSCGVGYLLTPPTSGFEAYAFSVTAWDCATGGYTFGHELAHNMGCTHAVGDSGTAQGDGLYNYSHGWRFSASGTKRTIMAYSPGTRIQHFSNPNVNFNGVATGRALGFSDEAYNALSINNTASIIANWWQSVVGCETYEPDDTSGQASVINSGVAQTHSIIPAADVDWVTFTLSEESQITIETSGASGNTRMWLYNSGLTLIEFNDDGGAGTFSRIDRVCGIDALPAGTYYVRIDEWGNNNEIACYNLSLSVTSCCNGYEPDDTSG
ncbi:MAG: DVUA0089 family protein, partial [Planctomycetes bacterium]|nr:DVUA0089 family protein [Planctomycetota bacterium]